MKKFRERTKQLDINPFNYTVIIVLTNDIQKSGAKRGVKLNPHVGAYHSAAADGALASQIVLPFNTDWAIVAHEAFHCVWNIMHCIGAQLEDEVMAYTLSYLLAEIGGFMKTRQKRRKKKVPRLAPDKQTLLNFPKRSGILQTLQDKQSTAGH